MTDHEEIQRAIVAEARGEAAVLGPGCAAAQALAYRDKLVAEGRQAKMGRTDRAWLVEDQPDLVPGKATGGAAFLRVLPTGAKEGPTG